MKILRKLLKINLRSVLLNFYLFPFKQAVKFPLLIARNVKITSLHRGAIILKNIFPGILQIGYNGLGTIDVKRDKTILQISKGGRMIVSGRCAFGTGCNISIGKNGVFELGSDICVTGRSTFIAHKKITISDNCLISWDCLFMDNDFHAVSTHNTSRDSMTGGGGGTNYGRNLFTGTLLGRLQSDYFKGKLYSKKQCNWCWYGLCKKIRNRKRNICRQSCETD